MSRYRFCPKCGKRADDKKDALYCGKCGFILYKNPIPAVLAVIYNDKGEVLLGKRSVEPVGKWAIIGGFLEAGELPDVGLRQEVKEELGAEIEIGEMLEMRIDNYVFDPEAGKSVLVISYLSKLKNDFETKDENSELKWFSEHAVPWNEIASEVHKEILKEFFEKLSRMSSRAPAILPERGDLTKTSKIASPPMATRNDKKEVFYKFCPKCGGDLDNLKCQNCGFVFYQNSRPTAGIVILNDKNQVLLMKRAADSRIGKWSLPGGFLENFETPEEAVLRETKEEIDVEVQIENFLLFSISKYIYEGGGYVLPIHFRGRIKSGEPKPTKFASEVRWFDRKDIPWDDIAFESNKKALKKVFEK